MMRPRPAPIAERTANLTPPARRAHQQQVRDVRASDQQDEADGADQHEQRLAHVADERFLKRRHAEALVVVERSRKFAPVLGGGLIELRFRLLECRRRA